MSTNIYPTLTDEQKQTLSARYGQAIEEENVARDRANEKIAAHRRAERKLKKLASDLTAIYQGRLPFDGQS